MITIIIIIFHHHCHRHRLYLESHVVQSHASAIIRCLRISNIIATVVSFIV